MSAIPIGLGEWMKPTFTWQVSGPIYTGPLDSEGNTIDFMLSPYRDRIAAKHFLQLALWRVGHLRPRVINVDGHSAYPSAIAELMIRKGQIRRLRKGDIIGQLRFVNQIVGPTA